MRYRRSNIGGGTYFFTLNLAERSRRLLVDHLDLLRDALRIVKQRHPFHIDAMVVLPDHVHAIWTLPPGDVDYPIRWMLIKGAFSRRLPRGERIDASRRGKGERGIWQRRYWEHTLRDEEDFRRHVDYVHYNPVKHEYVTHPSEWPHSSIHRYIGSGILPPDWGAAIASLDDGVFGGYAVLEQDVRRCLTRVFPYAVLYTIEPDFVLIVAVMRCHQKPGYWRHRVAS